MVSLKNLCVLAQTEQAFYILSRKFKKHICSPVDEINITFRKEVKMAGKENVVQTAIIVALQGYCERPGMPSVLFSK
ncbi:DNA polymerase III [Pseudomonas syringae pv. actinidiae]|uniref:DNA polymerase III n=1 Tax=Pseudomonas syringae pv. actinidiae TaxID=103796 RepID=A0A2V0QJB8_PSESF|nr:DNA polymerase III [Pseudomonas syringae pv. actinidiae]